MESVLPSNVVFLTDGAMDTEKSKTIEISMSKTRFLAASPSFQVANKNVFSIIIFRLTRPKFS